MLLAAQHAQKAYVSALRGILGGLHRVFVRSLADIGGWREDAGYSKWKRQIDRLEASIQDLRKPTGKAFDVMAVGVNKRNHAAAKTLLGLTPRDTQVHSVIATFRDQNISLVENAGRAYSADVREIFDDPDNFGLRPEALKALLLERGNVSESRAELIARDQTLKLNGQLNMVRQTSAGVEKYIWSTSHDERVREEHRLLDGTVQEWSSPPEPGHPGDDFQCRCIALPVLPDDLTTTGEGEDTDQ